MRVGLTGFSMNSRPWNSRPGGPNKGQKFADALDQEMGTPQFFCLRLSEIVPITRYQFYTGAVGVKIGGFRFSRGRKREP